MIDFQNYVLECITKILIYFGWLLSKFTCSVQINKWLIFIWDYQISTIWKKLKMLKNVQENASLLGVISVSICIN